MKNIMAIVSVISLFLLILMLINESPYKKENQDSATKKISKTVILHTNPLKEKENFTCHWQASNEEIEILEPVSDKLNIKIFKKRDWENPQIDFDPDKEVISQLESSIEKNDSEFAVFYEPLNGSNLLLAGDSNHDGKIDFLMLIIDREVIKKAIEIFNQKTAQKAVLFFYR